MRGQPDTGPEIEIEIDGVAAGGEGVGRAPDGRVVFVARTAPGDRVRVRLETQRARWARGRIVTRVVDGPERRPPPCALFEVCGGCAVQHLDAAAQRKAKRMIVAEALRRIGGRSVDVPPLAAGARELGYRNRVRFALRRTPGGVAAGYHALGRPGDLVDVGDCPLAEEPVRRAWIALRESWGEGAGALPGGDRLELTLRGAVDGTLALHVRGGEPGRPGRPGELSSALDGLVSYVWDDDGGRRHLLSGEAELEDVWQGIGFRLGPGVFLQVNREVSGLMDRYLDGLIGPVEGLRIADLYAGVGARAIRWAGLGAAVVAVEADRGACTAGEQASRRADGSVTFVRARVEDARRAVVGADLVVVNPPRAGLSAGVAGALTRHESARALAYVSCDPATLARDLCRLGDAWALESVQAFDAFPQTSHVETIAWLRRGLGNALREDET